MKSGSWEVYKIAVDDDGLTGEEEKMEASENFERELVSLIKKYQRKAGLSYSVENSEQELKVQ